MVLFSRQTFNLPQDPSGQGYTDDTKKVNRLLNSCRRLHVRVIARFFHDLGLEQDFEPISYFSYWLWRFQRISGNDRIRTLFTLLFDDESNSGLAEQGWDNAIHALENSKSIGEAVSHYELFTAVTAAGLQLLVFDEPWPNEIECRRSNAPSETNHQTSGKSQD